MAGHDNTVVNDALVREHAANWAGFTRFVTMGIISVILILLMFLLHFFVGWGYAVVFMILGHIALAIAAMLGKV
ncbi:hypothetical protein [Indioceanicola profundi]|uniref:hypothetical protein n=1 Tax=Indioceanicola profundi TaxID=2220096 RepID=UPI000E6AD812|nr:hypothetical protein [Indioceanicola profundi]